MRPVVAYGIAGAVGFSMMGMEILSSRVLAPVFGNSVQVWGALISVFMAGLGIGYAAGGGWADRRQRPLDLAWLLVVSAALLAALPGYQVAWCRGVGRMGLPMHWGALLAAAGLFVPACVCLGAVAPLLVRLTTVDAAHVGRGAGGIFALTTVGSIVGTLFTAFWLIGWVGTDRGMLTMSVPLVLAALAAAGFTSNITVGGASSTTESRPSFVGAKGG